MSDTGMANDVANSSSSSTVHPPLNIEVVKEQQHVSRQAPESSGQHSAPTAPSIDLNNVMAIDHALFNQHTQLEKAQSEFKRQIEKIKTKEDEQARLTQFSKQLDQTLQQTKKALESAYEKMLSTPDLNINSYQMAYQTAWSKVKQNQQDRLAIEETLSDYQDQLADKQVKITLIEKQIANLEQNKLTARAHRLKNELAVKGSEIVGFTNRCQQTMTLKQCEDQTVELALQKAAKQFQASLIKQTTESALVGSNIDRASLNLHLLNQKIKKASFTNTNRYQVIVDTRFEARPKETTACTLLGIDSQHCRLKKDNKSNEIAWFNLTVRSNLYHDNVVIDDVNYGASPVSITLPEGNHYIRVEKEGYTTYQQSLALKTDQRIRVVLKEKKSHLRNGYKFADAITKTLNSPELVVITPGKFFLGEHASTQYYLDHAFAISSTPVTVQLFKFFIEKSGYQTDAEVTKSCLAMQQGQTKPLKDHYWRNPGFKQTNHSPVVCVSKNDAYAFTQWLSKQTGYHYRLPAEEEWEIAARAGKQTDYWWGNQFMPGSANTGWGGSFWSNRSTSPVKAFPPNPLGLYDVVGNVWEWTNASQGIAKGGAWSFSPSNAKAYSMLYAGPTTSANYIGFRIVREINKQQ